MFSYVNGFKCAINESGDEVMLILTQNHPVFSDGNDAPAIVCSEVCSVAMSRDVAEKLSLLLTDILKNNNS